MGCWISLYFFCININEILYNFLIGFTNIALSFLHVSIPLFTNPIIKTFYKHITFLK